MLKHCGHNLRPIGALINKKLLVSKDLQGANL